MDLTWEQTQFGRRSITRSEKHAAMPGIHHRQGISGSKAGTKCMLLSQRETAKRSVRRQGEGEISARSRWCWMMKVVSSSNRDICPVDRSALTSQLLPIVSASHQTIVQNPFNRRCFRLKPLCLTRCDALLSDNLLGRFIQPDNIIPNPANPQSWNRIRMR